MNECVFAVKKLREEDVWMVGQLAEGSEDLMALGMAPPGLMECLAGDNANDTREVLVLYEEDTPVNESF